MQLDQRAEPDARPVDSPPDGSARTRLIPGGRLGIAVLLVVAVVLGVLGGLRYAGDVSRVAGVIASDDPMLLTEEAALTDLWREYKDTYLDAASRRTIDHQAGGITTSEGQSYTMLRAAWMDDQATFADSWQWTKDNLQRDDYLMAWRFGERADGSFGIQYDLGGGNTATDADVDIAFALLMAYSRWKDDAYLYDALPVIQSIWEKEVVLVGGEPVLVANDLERDNAQRVLLNPSYFAPYAYRVFANVDPDRDWLGLVDNTYALLEDLNRQPLDADRSAGLPPDWVYLDRRTGDFSAASGNLTTRFSYDALRLPWRLALDNIWYGEERARRLLERQAVLAREWTRGNRLVAAYNRDGTPAVTYEAPAMYGGAMGYFAVVQPDLAPEVYADALLPLYDADTGGLTEPLGYYDSNWVWFGMALYLGKLPNLNVTEE